MKLDKSITSKIAEDIGRVSSANPVGVTVVTKSTLQVNAHLFMQRNYGQPGDLITTECWMERYGILTAFIFEQFPEEVKRS